MRYALPESCRCQKASAVDSPKGRNDNGRRAGSGSWLPTEGSERWIGGLPTGTLDRYQIRCEESKVVDMGRSILIERERFQESLDKICANSLGSERYQGTCGGAIDFV